MAAASVLTVAAVGCLTDGGSTSPGSITTMAPLVTSASTLPAIDTSTTSTSTTSTSTTTTTTSTTLPPTTTTEPIVTEGGIVLVANASRVPGEGARLTAALADLGFSTNAAVNAAGSDEDLETSRIYARDTSDPVALSISRLTGGVPVLRMPTPAPVDGGTVGDATVVVMLGKDLVDVELQVG